jgi:hypothetical protein
MKLLSAFLVLRVCCSFVLEPTFAGHGVVRAPSLLKAVECDPEPDGGEELTSQTTMPGCRVKKMGEAEGATKTDDGTVYKFWITAEADGSLIKEYRKDVLKNAQKKANFPGFRKVSCLVLLWTGSFLRKAKLISCLLIFCIAIYTGTSPAIRHAPDYSVFDSGGYH